MNHTTHFHLVPDLKMCVKLYLHSSIRFHGVVINEALPMLWPLLRLSSSSSSRSAVQYPTAWNGDLGNLVVAQLVKKYPAFYASQTFSSVFAEPATGPYPELVNQIYTL